MPEFQNRFTPHNESPRARARTPRRPAPPHRLALHHRHRIRIRIALAILLKSLQVPPDVAAQRMRVQRLPSPFIPHFLLIFPRNRTNFDQLTCWRSCPGFHRLFTGRRQAPLEHRQFARQQRVVCRAFRRGTAAAGMHAITMFLHPHAVIMSDLD